MIESLAAFAPSAVYAGIAHDVNTSTLVLAVAAAYGLCALIGMALSQEWTVRHAFDMVEWMATAAASAWIVRLAIAHAVQRAKIEWERKR